MSTKRILIAVAVVAVFAFLGVTSASAQFQLPKKLPRIPVDKIPGLDRIPGMDKLLGKEVPVTTSLPDVLTEVPFLDSFKPAMPMSIGHALRTRDSKFELAPGAWTYEAQSYCLKAGTHAPGRGEGYGYAPLKGPKAPIVQSILRRSVDHPEIPQNEVQYLLWAIIARAKLSEMSRENQLVAAKLLTPKELSDLTGGALGILPNDVKAKLMSELPPALKSVIEAENRIRQMVTQVNASFADVERVAVLLGEPPADAGDRNDLPRQRWSYHPDGYFIRFHPSGYSTTSVDLYVPRPFTIVRDQRDRIVLIMDDQGRTIDLMYAPWTSRKDAPVRAHKFQRVRFLDLSTMPSEVIGEWKKTGWTLLGVPEKNDNTVAGEMMEMTDLSARLSNSRRRVAEFETLVGNVPKLRGAKRGQKKSPQAVVRDLIDLAHLYDGLSGVVSPKAKSDLEVAEYLNVVLEAWQSAADRALTETPRQYAALAPSYDQGDEDSGTDSGVQFDPSGNVGVPGQTGRQRLGQSARCQQDCACDREDFCKDVNAALQTLAAEMSNARSTPSSIASAVGQKLKDLEKGLCDNPETAAQVQQMIKELGSMGGGSRTDDYRTIARVEKMLQDMQKQVCGGPPPPKPCGPGTTKATPGDEQAAEQLTDGFNKAINDTVEELRKFDEGVPEYIQRGEAFKTELLEKLNRLDKLRSLVDKIRRTSCIPPNILPLLKRILENQRNHIPSDDECSMLCHETKKWFGDLIDSGGASWQEKLMWETCTAWCH